MHYINPRFTYLFTYLVYCACRNGRVDCCPVQLYGIIVSLLVLLSAVCALTAYTYYIHARLDALSEFCANNELSMPLNYYTGL